MKFCRIGEQSLSLLLALETILQLFDCSLDCPISIFLGRALDNMAAFYHMEKNSGCPLASR